MSYGELIGAVGGIISIGKTVWDVAAWWRNRGKLDVRVIRFQYYLIRYPVHAQAVCLYGNPAFSFAGPLGGKSKTAFSIIEFEVQNDFPCPVTVGRLELDDWVFSDHYAVPMYGPVQDYRVYDLYTRERVSLSTYHSLEPNHTLARRVEIVEKSSGPAQATHRLRLCLPERQAFVLRAASTKGTVAKTIPIPEPHEEFLASAPDESCRDKEKYAQASGFNDVLWEFQSINRWSGEDLIPGGQPGAGGEPRP